MHYKDPVITKLIEKFEAEGVKSLVGKYRYGDVTAVPKHELPICTIAKTSTITTPASNMESEYLMGFVINVIYDFTQDMRQDHKVIAGLNSVYDIIEGRDDTYQLKTTSLLYILQKHVQLDTDLWLSVGPNERIETTYGVGNQRRGPGIYSVEGILRFNAKLHKARPGL